MQHDEVWKYREFRLFICHDDIKEHYHEVEITQAAQLQSKLASTSFLSSPKFTSEKEMDSGMQSANIEKNLLNIDGQRERQEDKTQMKSNARFHGDQESFRNRMNPQGASIESLLDLFSQIFGLKENVHWLKRQAVELVLRQIIMGGPIERKVMEYLRSILYTENSAVQILRMIQLNVFPTEGFDQRTPDEKSKSYHKANQGARDLCIKLLGRMIGRRTARVGSDKIVYGFQNKILNRCLALELVDEFINFLTHDP